ncbi:MAG: VOC family protein [Pseudanabaenaceae cyanobacterium]
MHYHHVSIKTADIFRAIAFYEALGFTVEERFTADITLGCWLTGAQTRLELLQVPQPAPPPDSFGDEQYVGYYHLSFAVENLSHTLTHLAQTLGQVKILLRPRKQQIGDRTYQVCFLADPDGLPVELLEKLN